MPTVLVQLSVCGGYEVNNDLCYKMLIKSCISCNEKEKIVKVVSIEMNTFS